MKSEKSNQILEQIQVKFEKIKQDPEVHLEGLLWSKPITYWDYIHTHVQK